MRTNMRGFGVLVLVLFCIYAVWLNKQSKPEREPASSGSPIEEMLRVPPSVARQEGTAAAILMDTSGSMKDPVPDTDGKPKAKIDIARRSAGDLVRRFGEYSQKHADRALLLGIYEFSARDNEPACRPVIKLGPPLVEQAQAALDRLFPSGGTPIGDAMILAKKDLDLTGMTHRHLLVITDGENNRGYSPGLVASFLAAQAEEARASIYFIAFDIEAAKFNTVKESGGLVLAAANERDLNQTLDFILTGKILVEQPSSPVSK